jgi:nucleotide-binding universal stress UspA family protein
MFHKILVPLDGSPEAERALNPAVQLAKAVEGEIVLLRNIKVIRMMMPVTAAEYEWMWPDYSLEQSRQEVHNYLESIARRLEQPGIGVHVVAVEGDTAAGIVDTAVAEAVSLIVMSARGWSASHLRELGNITERVLYSAACPVLIIREAPIHRVAVTLDGSTLAEHAIAPALALVKGLQTPLALLRVTEPFSLRRAGVPEYAPAEHPRELAEAYVRNMVKQIDYPVQAFVVEGRVVDTILEFAQLHGIDLLVMSTHGRTGLRRWLYGSVTARVLRASQTSMLIIRPPAHELN